VPEEADLLSTRGLQNLLNRAAHVVQDEVLERQHRVLETRDPKVEQVDVEALLHQVFDQAVARYQV
jgi:hypothetical protein